MVLIIQQGTYVKTAERQDQALSSFQVILMLEFLVHSSILMPAIPGYGTCHRHGSASWRFIKQPIISSLLRRASLQVTSLLDKLHVKLNSLSLEFLFELCWVVQGQVL